MRIIIVGCGNVGTTLTEQLVQENHDISVIDTDGKKVQNIVDNMDVLGVVGNGASYSVQIEAGIEGADLLIAVTKADEVNLLCCLIAKKAGNCHTIARVRNPVYSREIDFIREELGLSMVINPEQATAMEVAKVLRYPSALQVDTFAKGKLELMQYRIPEHSMLAEKSLRDVSAMFRGTVLIGIVERGEEVFVPGGDFILKPKDIISLVVTPKNVMEFFKKLNVMTGRIHNALIVGGGTTAYYIAKMLIPMGIQIKMIESNKKRCDELSELLPQALIIHADGTERGVLEEEGISRADAFVAWTNIDEENIMLSLFAKKLSRAKTITKIEKFSHTGIINTLDLDTVVYPKYTTAEHIIQYVRAMSNSIGSNVETLYRLMDNKVEALEFAVREKSKVVGVPLQKLSLRKNLLVCAIIRKKQVITPGGQDEIQVGDNVIVVTTIKGLNDIRDILDKR